METLITLASLAALGLSTHWVLKNLPNVSSPLCPGPYWQYFYFQIPFLIFPVILGLHLFGAASSHLFSGVTDTELLEGSAWVVYGLLAFSVSLVWLVRLLGGWARGCARIEDGLVVIMLAVLLPSLMAVIYIKSGDLAILHLGDAEIGVIRKQLTTSADFSPYFGSALNYLGFFGAAYAGHLAAGRKRILAGVAVCVSIIALAWSGAKSPPVVGLLTFYFAFMWFAGRNINVLKLLVIALLGAMAVFVMFALTLPHLDGAQLLDLMTTRLFLAQMSGFYQAISFAQPDPSYVAPWVPFSRLLGFDQTPFARDLMVQLYGDTDTNGFLNSIFLQDAWAGLGYFGLIISPLWMALSVAAAIRLLSLALRKIASPAMIACVVFSFLNVNTLTASFGQMAFLKALFFPLALFSAFSISCLAVKQLRASVAN